MDRFSRLQHNLIPIAILITLFLSQAWHKLPDAPEPFTATYITGFSISIPLLITLGLWIINGFKGISRLYKSKTTLLWFLCLLAFMGWAILSQHWDFVRDERAGVTQNAALQITLVFLFSIVVLCQPPDLKWVIWMGLLILGIQVIIGGLQVASQSTLGLKTLGEFTLNPAKSGVSVIQSGDIRWLRPYGLLPHPNIFAGLVIYGLFACGAIILSKKQILNIGGGVFFLIGLWIFLLTFSRGAWASFGVSVLICLFFILRYIGIQKRFVIIAIASILLGIFFLLLYRPLMASRVGISEESIEMRSVADRIVFNEIAFDAIQTSPYIGIGAGNFPWYASSYLFYKTDYDLRGDNVHLVMLGIWSEYGLVGLILISINIATALFGSIRNIIRYPEQRPERIALFGTSLAFLVVGLVDHYPWTFIHMQILWFTMMALGLSTPNIPPVELPDNSHPSPSHPPEPR